MEILISIVLGYLFGSIPTAYILLKRTSGIDITQTGTGNVGAMNSYEITNSKLTGLIVLLIDFLKGFLPVLLLKSLFPDVFLYPALAVIFAVFSHCYNPWIGFRGGRGLATAAGGTILLFPYILVLWLVMWAVIYVVKKDILFANVWSNIMTVIVIFTTADIAVKYSFPKADSIPSLIFFVTASMIIIFIKHIEPLKELISKNKIFSLGKKGNE